MSVLDTLITDRTQADAEERNRLAAKDFDKFTAAEKEYWMGSVKGAYTATDLNRVGRAMAYIAEAFNEAGYTVNISPKTDWTMNDTLTSSDVADYLDNLSVLREAFTVMQGTPEVPGSLENMTVETANDIERILSNIGTVLNQIEFSKPRLNAFGFFLGQLPLPSFYDQYLLADKDHFLLRTSDGKFLMVW